MKKTFYFILVAALSAAVFASCNKVEEEEVVTPVDDTQVEEPAAPVVNTLTFALQGDEATKAILGTEGKMHGEWQTGDKIGDIVNGKASGGFSTVDITSSPATFSVSCSGGFEAGDKIYAWFPYGEKQTNPASVTMSIPAEQYKIGGSFDFSAMPMVAEEINVTAGMIDGSGNSVSTIDFYNLGSLIDFKVFASSSYTTEKVLSVTFNASGNIAGSFVKDMTDAANLLSISGNTGTSVKANVLPFTTVGSSSESPLDVYMVVAPGTYSGSIVVETDAATYTWALSSKEFQRSHVRSFGLQLDKPSGVTRVAHVKGSFAWDLSKASYDAASTSSATWSHGFLTMSNAKNGAGTNVNNWIPTNIPSAKDETRFYTNQKLTFTPAGMQIEKVVFSSRSYGNADDLVNSTWTNATASIDGTSVVVVPTDGSASFNVVMGAATGWREVRVYYDDTDYIITKGSEVNGTFTVSASTAKVNSTIDLDATPNSGYYLSAWSVTPGDIPVVADKFQMPAHNVTVDATFALGGYAINIADSSNGSVSTSPANSATSGTEVTITVTPDDGYVLETLQVVDAASNVITVSDNVFTMPENSVTITATFARVYSIVFNTTTMDANSNSYSGSFNTTSDGITVACVNFNNYNKNWEYIKAGAKSTTTTATITTQGVISDTIRKVVVPLSILIGSPNATTTAKLYVASDAVFSEDLQTIDLGTIASGNIEFAIPSPAANRYYKLEFVCTNSTSSGGVVQINSILFSTID